jgi:hypothetical protein
VRPWASIPVPKKKRQKKRKMSESENKKIPYKLAPSLGCCTNTNGDL